jgi:folate-binding Fe-S cluster repair protein YgfZ
MAAVSAHCRRTARGTRRRRHGPLTDLGLIRVSGVDSAVFLHNLLTNDIKGINPDGARFAGFCTAKGRLLALLLIWREGDDFLLMLPRDILP